ncbi:Cytochrome P450 89A2-like protein [Drosera capensis]
METWFVIITTICLLALFKSLFNLLCNSEQKGKNNKLPLPPGPTPIPIIGVLSWVGKGLPEFEVIFRSLFSKYGPIISLSFGSTPTILIANGTVAHEALVQNSIIFANRVKPGITVKIMTSDQHTVSFANGPNWRLLRRNMASFFHPSRLRYYSRIRRRVLRTLIDRLKTDSQSHAGPKFGSVEVTRHFQITIFSTLAFMCYGENIDEKSITQMEKATREMIECGSRFQILDLWPLLGKTLLYHRWKEFLSMRKDLEDSILPHIRAQIQAKDNQRNLKEEKDCNGKDLPKYVDTLLELELEEEEGRALTEDEMVFEEIKNVVGEAAEEVTEEDLPNLQYLRAVILEGLRRHPAGNFALPRSINEEVEVAGYTLPKGASINFMVSEVGWDPKVWDEPMKFKPERFLAKELGGSGDEAFDIKGNREIKMMPFGAGRRICPGYSLGMLHLEYFVSNLVLKFQWKAVEGDDIDLTEKHVEPFVLMKHPLRAQISSRTQK